MMSIDLSDPLELEPVVSTNCQSLDSDCDVAAIVFEANEDADGLLEAFVDDLDWQGFNVRGFVQRGSCTAREGLELHLWPSRQWVRIPSESGSIHGLQSSSVLESALRPSLLATDIDLAVVNRYGKLEAGGHGFRDDIVRLARAGVPVLTAVAKHRFDSWNRFVGGLSVALRCRRNDLDRWWGAVSSPPASGPGTPQKSFCQNWK